MAIWKRYRASRKGSRYKVGSRGSTTRRRVGAFGLYRGTRNVATLRAVARSYNRTSRVPRGLNPFPNSKLVRHKYVDSFALPAASGAGLNVVWQWRANSVYDPDYTTTGHQPMFHDQMAAEYNHYTVLHSTIRVSFPPESTTKQNILLWCDDDSSVPGNALTAQEQHSCFSAVKLSAMNKPLVLKGRYNAARWNKTSKAGILADQEQKVPSGSNPPSKVQKFFTLYCSPVILTETISTQAVRVELVYYTLWREPVDHIGS